MLLSLGLDQSLNGKDTLTSSNWLLLLLLFWGSIVGCQQESGEQKRDLVTAGNTDNEKVRKVPTMLLQKEDFYEEIISQGKIEAKYRSVVTFDLDGKIEKVLVEVGQRVQKGILLATLDDFGHKYELERTEQNIEKAKLNIEEKLISLGYSSDSIIDSVLKRRISIKFDLFRLYAERKKILHQMEQTKVKAPISGVVIEVEAQPNNPTSNYKSVCTIVDDQSLQVIFPILESELAKVKPGSPIKFYPLYQSNNIYRGKIKVITPKVDDSGMLQTYARILNSSNALFEGMKVEVLIQNVVLNQLVVPKSAVIDRQGQQVVFTYSNGNAIWNYIKLGKENTHSYIILEGLSSGDTIITGNNLLIAHEQKVMPQNE